MARALRDFVEQEGGGYLPLPGDIPDMTADTQQYVNLQNVYRCKASLDSDIIYRRVQQLLKELELSSDLISEKDVKLFSRESAHLAVIRGNKIADEYFASFLACEEFRNERIEKKKKKRERENSCLVAAAAAAAGGGGGGERGAGVTIDNVDLYARCIFNISKP